MSSSQTPHDMRTNGVEVEVNSPQGWVADPLQKAKSRTKASPPPSDTIDATPYISRRHTPKSPSDSIRDSGRGPSIHNTRDSLDLTQKRWSPLFPTEEGKTPSDNDNDGHSNPTSDPRSETSRLHVEDAKGHGDAKSVHSAVSDSVNNGSTRRSVLSRARTQPGYVHSTLSPPSSVKGKFKGPEEQYQAVQEAATKLGSMAKEEPLEPPKMSPSAMSPPISPMPRALSGSASVPAFLKRADSRPPPLPPIAPSLRLLHSVVPLRTRLPLLSLAIIASLAGAVIQPLVSIVVGEAFGALAAFPLDYRLATTEQKKKLLDDVGWSSQRLAILGAASCVLEYLINVAWTNYGETVAACLRTTVYDGVRSKPMEWYDTGMGMEEGKADDKARQEAVGAAGLMGKFAR